MLWFSRKFGGSVMMAKQITELNRRAHLIAVADYHVIPKYLFGVAGKPAYADWYAGFARNAITFTYTDQSKFGGEVAPRNWYRILARPGVEIGRSNPDTDPSVLALSDRIAGGAREGRAKGSLAITVQRTGARSRSRSPIPSGHHKSR
jgi:tungstate ABC transporter binding protein WtpA